MLRVFVCEDNNSQRKQYTQTIENYIAIEDLDMKIALSSHSPNEILSYLEKNEAESGLYFLDMDLNCDTDGIALAEEIRKHDPRGFIVYITAYAETLPLTFKYKIEALDFITKEDSHVDERIRECISDAYTKHTGKSVELQDNFVFKVGQNVISLNHTKILFFESSQDVAHKVTVYADSGAYTFYGKLIEIERDIGATFYRCHKSYIVNIKRIKNIDTVHRIVTLDNDAVCYVSALKLKRLLNLIYHEPSTTLTTTTQDNSNY
jgi:two-component system response regulator AgrA